MASEPKLLIEVELGKKGVERTDIFVYKDGKLIESHFDMSYNDIETIENNLRKQFAEAEIEKWCVGEDCLGGLHRWSIEPQ